MSGRYHIRCGKNLLDLVRLAVLEGEQTKRSLSLILCEGSSDLLFWLGQNVPPIFPGALNLLRYPFEKVSTPVSFGAVSHKILYPPGSGHANSNLRSILDGARERFTEGTTIDLIMSFDSMARHIPPLISEDAVSCFWEIRDLPHPELPLQAENLAGEVLSVGASFNGLRLYSRKRISDIELNEREQSIRLACPVVSQDAVTILE
ncbi:MAG: hypothetical protein SGI71_00940 [Verrucomicrobiota bacterium]|nr:hypothetical protein [Verrucomicrobiota bacterium]